MSAIGGKAISDSLIADRQVCVSLLESLGLVVYFVFVEVEMNWTRINQRVSSAFEAMYSR
jgi:hypothetical protein